MYSSVTVTLENHYVTASLKTIFVILIILFKTELEIRN